MTKEEVFKLMTRLITELGDKRPFLEKPELIDEWKENQRKFNIAVGKLSSCDQLWLSEKYDIWFKSKFADPAKIKEYQTKMFGQDVPK